MMIGALRKLFEIFKKDLHHRKADKILTFPHLPHRSLFKVFEYPFKHRMSPEGTIVPGELSSILFYVHERVHSTIDVVLVK